MIVTINATKARQNFFEILLAARDKKQVTKIRYQGKMIAKIIPEEEPKIDWDKYVEEVEKGVKYLRKVGWKENKDFRKNFKFRKW